MLYNVFEFLKNSGGFLSYYDSQGQGWCGRVVHTATDTRHACDWCSCGGLAFFISTEYHLCFTSSRHLLFSPNLLREQICKDRTHA